MDRKYKKMDQEDFDFLRSVCPDRVSVRGEIGEDYWHDELGGIRREPEALVKVLSTDEVSRIMRYAYENNIPDILPAACRDNGNGLQQHRRKRMVAGSNGRNHCYDRHYRHIRHFRRTHLR